MMVAMLALTSFLVGFHLGPIFAIAQTVAKPSMRALASALIALTATCFGQGVGPLAVGMVNHALKGYLWRGRGALFPALGGGHDHTGAPCCSSGRPVRSGTISAGRPA